MLRPVRRAMPLTTVIVAMGCIPAGPALAELGDPDPGGGNATTSTTVDTTPTTDPSPDSTTTTTTTPTDPSTTTTTAPADDDAGATTTSSSTSTTTTTPGGSTTSTSIPSSGGSGRSTTTTRPSSTPTTVGSAPTTAPAPSHAGAVVNSNTADGADPGDGDGDTGGSTSSRGSGRTIHPSPTRPDKQTEESAEMAAAKLPDPLSFPGDTPVPPGFDASGLGGFLGVGANANPVPAGETAELALADSESALPSRDHDSPSSAVLLGLSLLILLTLAGGTAYRWWDRRPDRYWPA